MLEIGARAVAAAHCDRKRATCAYAQALGREMGGDRRLHWVLQDAAAWVVEGFGPEAQLSEFQDACDFDGYVAGFSRKRAGLDELFKNASQVVANGSAGSKHSEIVRLEHFLDVYQAALHFTERFDGGGLPDRQSGESISLASRILAVAYGWTSLTDQASDRLSHERAIDRLTVFAGSHFDPEIVAAAGRVVEKQRLDRAGIACLPRAGLTWVPMASRRRPGFARELAGVPDRTEMVERMRRRSRR